MSKHVEFLRGLAAKADQNEFPPTAAGLRRAADELERLEAIAVAATGFMKLTRAWDLPTVPAPYTEALVVLKRAIEAADAAEGASDPSSPMAGHTPTPGEGLGGVSLGERNRQYQG